MSHYLVWQLELYIIEQLDKSIIKICRAYRSRFMVRVRVLMVRVPSRFMIWCSFWGLVCVAVIVSVSLPLVIYNAKETNLIKSFVVLKANNNSNPKCFLKSWWTKEIALRWNYLLYHAYRNHRDHGHHHVYHLQD